MKAFYNQLISTFITPETKGKFTSKGIIPIKHIDLYAGQDFNENSFETHGYPALFIQWSINYSTTPAVATITFKICNEQLRDVSSISQSREKGLKFMDLINITDSIIKTIETEHTGKLTLLSEDFNIEDTIVDTYTLVYQCSYTGKQNTLQKEYLQGTVDKVSVDSGLFQRLMD